MNGDRAAWEEKAERSDADRDADFKRAYEAALRRRGLTEQHSPASRWLLFLKAVPGFAALWQQVPAAYFEPTDASADVMVVACPCSARPEVSEGHSADCECQRTYLHLAGRVYVAFGPKQEPKLDRCEWADPVD